MVGYLSLGTVPGAICGARTNLALPTAALTIVLATLTIFSGLNALYRQPQAQQKSFELTHIRLAVIGLLVGFGSALTGTGGPLLLVPILTLLDVPALVAIGASQVTQVAVASSAAIGFAFYGEIDFQLGTMLGIIQAVGVLLGVQIAHSVPSKQLRRIVALALISVGFFLLARAFF